MSCQMNVFDSNIWVYGITETAPFPTQLVNEAENGRQQVVLNAYIYEEVREAIHRSKSVPQREVEQTVTNFATRIAKAPTINEPAQENVEAMNLDAVRGSPPTQLLGHLLGIQPKDVPILCLAYRWKHRNPTIYTNDSGFAALDPSDYGISDITITHVSQ